jgi:hypothetical protein
MTPAPVTTPFAEKYFRDQRRSPSKGDPLFRSAFLANGIVQISSPVKIF